MARFHKDPAAKGPLLGFTRTKTKELGPLSVPITMVLGGLLGRAAARTSRPIKGSSVALPEVSS